MTLIDVFFPWPWFFEYRLLGAESSPRFEDETSVIEGPDSGGASVSSNAKHHENTGVYRPVDLTEAMAIPRSLLGTGVSFERLESAEAALEPMTVSTVGIHYDRVMIPGSPLPSLLIDCPPTVALPDTDPGIGDGAAGCGEATFRICARTWESCRSYSHAACWSKNGSVTL